MRPRRRTESVRGPDVLLVALAVVGAAVLVARLVGALLGFELVVFATGSMTPAYPQGVVAVSQREPLDAVRVGDVVTIDRPGLLPITHRVVSVRIVGAGQAELRLKGDANRDPDPAPYVVDHLSRVLLPLPTWLWPLQLLGTAPAVIAGAVLAALAVGWAFWPRRTPVGAAPAA